MFRNLVILGCLIATSVAAEPVIKKGAAGWKAWDLKAAPDEGWKGIEFDDAAWKEATTPLGYGKEPVTTTLSFGGDGEKKHPTAYLRKAFEVKEKAAGYVIKVRLDDGAILSLNGKEIQRLYVAPDVKPGEYSKLALGPGVLELESTLILEAEHVKVGKNILAIALFQAGPKSSDLYLNLELKPVDAEGLEALKKEAAERKQKRDEAEKKEAEQKKSPVV